MVIASLICENISVFCRHANILYLLPSKIPLEVTAAADIRMKPSICQSKPFAKAMKTDETGNIQQIKLQNISRFSCLQFQSYCR